MKPWVVVASLCTSCAGYIASVHLAMYLALVVRVPPGWAIVAGFSVFALFLGWLVFLCWCLR